MLSSTCVRTYKFTAISPGSSGFTRACVCPVYCRACWPRALQGMLAPCTAGHAGPVHYRACWPRALQGMLAPWTAGHAGPVNCRACWPRALQGMLAPCTAGQAGPVHCRACWPRALLGMLAPCSKYCMSLDASDPNLQMFHDSPSSHVEWFPLYNVFLSGSLKGFEEAVNPCMLHRAIEFSIIFLWFHLWAAWLHRVGWNTEKWIFVRWRFWEVCFEYVPWMDRVKDEEVRRKAGI